MDSAPIIAECSPFLRDILDRHPDWANCTLDDVCAEVSQLTGDELRAGLRIARQKAALLIALADVGGRWDLEQVTAALTRFADTCLRTAVDRLGVSKGYVVLAMGKHGAFELNYSSDIDLIVLYDPETPGLPSDPAIFFVRMTRKLVSILQDMTVDGYVFRVDLRLRPDPRATQIAISVEAAGVYYESMGQNWERAAMIKARAVAGNLALGEAFLDRLKPYIWRKYLDFAAIADVQSLKRQIHAVKGHGDISVEGHNIKLGRGGIREIEFFVQTQQLIAGGRNPSLRGRGTLDMLRALADAKWITDDAARELQDAYRFLRTVEHRLQMVDDEQTQTLPTDEHKFVNVARFAGFDSAQAFSAKMRATLECVQGHYAALFEDAGGLGHGEGNLVFTGGEDDPGTIETLQRMGYRQASEVSATVRGWHFGRYAATRSSKSRELLTELMPALLSALARGGDADQAFLAFDKFIAGLPAGVQLFSMLKANPKLLDLLATVLVAAPRVAAQLSARPRILEAVLEAGFFDRLLDAAEIAALVAETIPLSIPLDEAADRARVLGRELMFRTGVRILSESVSAEEAGQSFSHIAAALLDRLHQSVRASMRDQHGEIPGGRSAVIAMGKLGGSEMTASSDLDLILVYDFESDATQSDGKRPLSVTQYYARETQRLIAALSAPTAEGILYDVDMRLRPSGSKGPVAVSLESFRLYHRESSWTWEKMALTRARAVSGDPDLRATLDAEIGGVLHADRDVDQLRADVIDMRKLMLKEQGSAGAWDIKRAPGGIVELEFIAQTLQLADPAVLRRNTGEALQLTSRLTAAQRLALVPAHALYHRLTQLLRLCLTGNYDPRMAPPGLNQLVINAAGMPDIATAEALLLETQGTVRKLFEELIGPLH